MPDTEAQIQDGDIYFVIYGGDESRFLKEFIAELFSEYNHVTASKLDWK